MILMNWTTRVVIPPPEQAADQEIVHRAFMEMLYRVSKALGKVPRRATWSVTVDGNTRTVTAEWED